MEYLLIAAVIVGAVLFVWITNRHAELPQSLRIVGSVGLALSVIGRDGKVEIQGEVWGATSKKGLIDQGAKVLVVGIQPGMVLEVEAVQ